MKTTIKQLFILVIIALVTACSDDDKPIPDYTTAEALLEENGFQGSILIRKGTTDFLRKGFGMADAQENITNDPGLIYRIGSVTKTFTAMGLAALKRDGLIDSYDQTISDFDDEFPNGDKITLRHLLTHYSGIPDYTSAVEESSIFFTPNDIYDLLKESAETDGLLFEPGSQFAYSNSNYLILGLLIEALSDMSYHEYLQSKVFGPLGMENTGKGENEIEGENFAKGYLNGVEVAPYQMQIAYSAGDLISTIGDLEKWADAMMGDSFISAPEKAEIFAEPHSEDNFFTPGLGWYTIKIDGTLIYNHGGNIDGFTSIIALLPETNSMIIMLSNQDSWEPINEVLDALIINEF